MEAFWRKFNIDGSKQPLNFIERMTAYGVKLDQTKPGQPVSFSIAALPERKLTVSLDGQHRPQAADADRQPQGEGRLCLSACGGRRADAQRAGLDIFGTDIASGKAIHEHLIQK